MGSVQLFTLFYTDTVPWALVFKGARKDVFSMTFQEIMSAFPERITDMTGVPFGRTDLSIGGIGTTFHALLHRHGPVGPSFQGMPEKFDLITCFLLHGQTK